MKLSDYEEINMVSKRPATIPEYIKNAPKISQSHLRQIYKLLTEVAPGAQGVIKWGNPFFIEPRFLFAFSAHKAHLSFAPSPEAMEKFHKQLGKYDTTKYMLRIAYDQPLPEALIRKIAKYCVKQVGQRNSESFW